MPIDLDPRDFGDNQPCFGCSPDHPIGFHLRFTREGNEVFTRFTPGTQYQGPPGLMHGGLVTTLADEIGAWAIIGLLEKFGFTAKIDVKLRAAIRIGVEVVGRAWIVRETSRIVEVGVELTQEGSVALAGQFAFVLMDRKGAERLLGGPIPEAWVRYCR